MDDSNERMDSEAAREYRMDAWSLPPGPEPLRGDQNLIAGAARASVDAMTIEERLTWKQICERYPERFVVLIDHERLPHISTGFKTARVLSFGSTRAEAQERGRPQLDLLREWGCHFTGPIRGPRFGYRPWFIP